MNTNILIQIFKWFVKRDSLYIVRLEIRKCYGTMKISDLAKYLKIFYGSMPSLCWGLQTTKILF